MWPVRTEMPLLGRGGGLRSIEKGIYYVDGLCAIQILLGRVYDPLLRGGLYASLYGRVS
jgi:hypothetical protein